jgi:transposase, IS6 family
VEHTTRPAIFKWRQTAPELILCAVRWYLRYSPSLRDIEELFAERGLAGDHTTIWRWVQRYGPELDQRLRRHLKPTNKSWRVDETYIRVKGRWCYLYRAIDSSGATIDFLLSALRERLFRNALSDPSHPRPRVINTIRPHSMARRLLERKQKEPCAAAAGIGRCNI